MTNSWTLPTLLNPNPSRNSENPLFLGLPLKYVSLVILAVQNATLSIVMHYSRVSTPPGMAYSAATAVLLNEIFKGCISFALAVATGRGSIQDRFRYCLREVFSADCWKLSVPAILYVIQNNLQYVAISNLSAATFQVAYQMKILTTAFFSVLLLHKSLSKSKWFALLLLSAGVGIVQVQAGLATSPGQSSNNTSMSPTRGFLAVLAACFTSGLAGVYFEMVLKTSKTDLWIRNVQLSLFSLCPAFVPIIFSSTIPAGTNPFAPTYLLRNFTPAAWATVGIQVFGGLVTAVVIKYSDNILKGFATSLAIIISFLASVLLFQFPVTYTFLTGAGVVLYATWMYNQPSDSAGEPESPNHKKTASSTSMDVRVLSPHMRGEADAPILGQATELSEKGNGGGYLVVDSDSNNVFNYPALKSPGRVASPRLNGL